MKPLVTDRLVLRPLTPDDAPFILRLVNDPAWRRHIGDKGVRSLADACAYLENGPLAMYQRHGCGLLRTELRESGTPIGICGLLRRETLPDPDLGFAFLPEYRAQGYALEAATATVAHGKHVLHLRRLVAITSPGNEASVRLLRKIGFHFEGLFQLAEGAPQVELHALVL